MKWKKFDWKGKLKAALLILASMILLVFSVQGAWIIRDWLWSTLR